MQWRELAWREDPELGELRATQSGRTKMCVWYRSADGKFDVIRGGGTPWTKAKFYHLLDAETGEHLGAFGKQEEAMAEADGLSS